MIIFDSSTLILLAKTDLLELFVLNSSGKVLIPGMVRTEVCIEEREGTSLIAKLIDDKKIEVLEVRNNRQVKKLMDDFNIDIGEAEALILAVQEGAGIIATDDRNAIKACKILKLDFVTAIAILIRAFEKKLIDKDDALIKLQKLEMVGRYGKTIIEDAAKKLKGGI